MWTYPGAPDMNPRIRRLLAARLPSGPVWWFRRTRVSASTDGPPLREAVLPRPFRLPAFRPLQHGTIARRLQVICSLLSHMLRLSISKRCPEVRYSFTGKVFPAHSRQKGPCEAADPGPLPVAHIPTQNYLRKSREISCIPERHTQGAPRLRALLAPDMTENTHRTRSRTHSGAVPTGGRTGLLPRDRRARDTAGPRGDRGPAACCQTSMP